MRAFYGLLACVTVALRVEPSAVPRAARLHLLDSCSASAFSKDPDTVTSASARAAVGTAALSAGLCYAAPGSGSFSFSVRQVRSDVGASGRGAAVRLVAFLERFSDAACSSGERLSRRTLPAAAHRECTRMPPESALAKEAWFLLEVAPPAAPGEPAAAAPSGGSAGGSAAAPPAAPEPWAPKDPRRVVNDFLAEERARELTAEAARAAREQRERQKRRERDAAEAGRRQRAAPAPAPPPPPPPAHSATPFSLGGAWEAGRAAFQIVDSALVTGALVCVAAAMGSRLAAQPRVKG